MARRKSKRNFVNVIKKFNPDYWIKNSYGERTLDPENPVRACAVGIAAVSVVGPDGVYGPTRAIVTDNFALSDGDASEVERLNDMASSKQNLDAALEARLLNGKSFGEAVYIAQGTEW